MYDRAKLRTSQPAAGEADDGQKNDLSRLALCERGIAFPRESTRRMSHGRQVRRPTDGYGRFFIRCRTAQRRIISVCVCVCYERYARPIRSSEFQRNRCCVLVITELRTDVNSSLSLETRQSMLIPVYSRGRISTRDT